MEFPVEIGTGGTVLSESAPNNPAGLAAREELGKIMSDTSHPMHAGYLRNDKAVEAHLEAVYRKAYPETPAPNTPPAPASTPEQAPDTTLSLEDRAAHTELDTTLRRTFGEDYDSEMSNMRVGASHLFTSPESHKVLADFSHLITGLGPLAEVRAIRFLAEIGALIKQQGGQKT